METNLNAPTFDSFRAKQKMIRTSLIRYIVNSASAFADWSTSPEPVCRLQEHLSTAGEFVSDPRLVVRAWEAIRPFVEPCRFALYVGARAPLPILGPVGYLMAAEPNLRSALRSLHAYAASVSSAVESQLVGVDGRVRFSQRWLSADAAAPESYISVAASWASFPAVLAGSSISPVEVALPAACRHGARELEEFFGTPVMFGGEAVTLVWDGDAAERPFESASDDVRRALLPLLEVDLSGSTAARLERALTTLEAPARVSVRDLAQTLGKSVRSLQRNLASEKTSFREIHDRVVLRAADVLLRDANLTLEVVAERLGYGSRSSFTRAFIRATGETPSERRRSFAEFRP